MALQALQTAKSSWHTKGLTKAGLLFQLRHAGAPWRTLIRRAAAYRLPSIRHMILRLFRSACLLLNSVSNSVSQTAARVPGKMFVGSVVSTVDSSSASSGHEARLFTEEEFTEKFGRSFDSSKDYIGVMNGGRQGGERVPGLRDVLPRHREHLGGRTWGVEREHHQAELPCRARRLACIVFRIPALRIKGRNAPIRHYVRSQRQCCHSQRVQRHIQRQLTPIRPHA